MKVITTLVFISLTAALALPPPPDKGTFDSLPPQNLPPPPSNTHLLPPHSTNINTHTPDHDNSKANENDNTHLPRADVDPFPPENGLPPFKGPPRPQPDFCPFCPPPPPPHFPHLASHHGKANDNNNANFPRADADLPPPKKGPPPFKGLPPPPKTGDLPPANTPVPYLANTNTHSPGQDEANAHLPRGDAKLPPKKGLPPPPKTDLPPPTSTPVPPSHGQRL